MLAWMVAVSVAGCLATSPPQRLATATPIALQVQLEAADGRAVGVPASVVGELDALLAARNLQVVHAQPHGEARTSEQRLAALVQASDTPWVLLVEARARFFSQLSGRYRWEVEVRTSLVAREHPDAPQVSDLSVAAFLSFEHEAEPDALAFVRRQLDDDIGALVDRVLGAR